MRYGKGIPYDDKKGKEYETGSKIAPIHQGMQVEEEATRGNKTRHKNEQKKSIKVDGYGKWCAQDKINNKQNSFVQNKYGYYDVINNYIQKLMTKEGNY